MLETVYVQKVMFDSLLLLLSLYLLFKSLSRKPNELITY